MLSDYEFTCGTFFEKGEAGNVMFYLYPTTSGEGDIFGAFERCKENSTAPLSAQLEGGHFRNHSLHKHGDDLWFYDAVQTSKYRTYDPEQATLFVIPVLISLMLR